MEGFSKTKESKSKRAFQKKWDEVFKKKSRTSEEVLLKSNSSMFCENEHIGEFSRNGDIKRDGYEDFIATEGTEDSQYLDSEGSLLSAYSDEDDEGNGDNCTTNEVLAVGCPFNDYDEGLNVICSVFVKNNVSRNLGQDIFEIAKILNVHTSISLTDVLKRVSEWGRQETRLYVYCVSCSRILNSSKKCQNPTCSRFNVSQANVSSLKSILTFSLRKQVKQLIRRGAFDESLLKRTSRETSLNSRICYTPNYKHRLKLCEKDHPGMITLLMSLNTDGFRKRGCSRGEIWPLFLAVHDVMVGEGSFREFKPEVILLSAIMQYNKKLTSSDFDSLFQRMNLEINETTRNPLRIHFNGTDYAVRLELFQSCIDMDASRKIHGLPIWNSYRSCSYCTVTGRKLKTKGGSTICWCPESGVMEYNRDHIPPKLINSSIPPPFENSFDGLHVIWEGTSRDLIKDLFGTGKRTRVNIKKSVRSSWAKALNSANTPRGRGSSGLLDPIQLSSRTGREVQELYDITIPTLLNVIDARCEWTAMVLLHWLVTRKVLDAHISIGMCMDIDRLTPPLRHLVSRKFPLIYTMKFHFLIDHLTSKLRSTGSPNLTSAAPYERLNQTMGRSSNSYTTRTLLNISNRFLALKRASCYYSKDSTRGMEKVVIDSLKLTAEEIVALEPFNTEHISFRLSWVKGTTKFAVRRCSSQKLVHNCFVYYFDDDGDIGYGCIERIFIFSERCYTLIQKFQTQDPFTFLYDWISENQMGYVDRSTFNDVNSYYLQIVDSSYAVIESECLEGFVTILEFSGKSFLSRC